MTTTMTRTNKEVIQAATIARVTSKTDGAFLGYLVKSDSTEDWYQVVWSYENKRWECNCKCGQTHNHAKTCKHIVAVSQTCQAKAALKQAESSQPVVETPKVRTVDDARRERIERAKARLAQEVSVIKEAEEVAAKASCLYEVHHCCGHTVTRKILESSPTKCQRVVKWLETIRCYECLNRIEVGAA